MTANRVEPQGGVWHCNGRNLHSCFSKQFKRHSCSAFPCFMAKGCAYLGLQVKAINCVLPCLCPVLIGFNPIPTGKSNYIDKFKIFQYCKHVVHECWCS
jgi:hypothetical protein